MRAEERILSLLEAAREKGVPQSEIVRKLNLSKSTVSEILSKLEEKRIVVRREVSQKSYHVWLLKYHPGAIKGILRIGILKASEYARIVGAGEKVEAIFKVYRNGIEATRDLVHGVVDVLASPFITQTFFGVLMKNIKIFRVVAMNGSGVAISDGKGFGCSEFSTMERILRKYLKVKGLKGEIFFFDSPEEMIERIQGLKGIAIWEPYLSMFERVERFNDVLGDFICCSLAVNEDFLATNHELFEEFLKHYDKTLPSKGVKKLAELIG
ncbi:MAG: MarR family transcriptional regulator, partial [Archaeoglobaceae archaeon]